MMTDSDSARPAYRTGSPSAGYCSAFCVRRVLISLQPEAEPVDPNQPCDATRTAGFDRTVLVGIQHDQVYWFLLQIVKPRIRFPHTEQGFWGLLQRLTTALSSLSRLKPGDPLQPFVGKARTEGCCAPITESAFPATGQPYSEKNNQISRPSCDRKRALRVKGRASRECFPSRRSRCG